MELSIIVGLLPQTPDHSLPPLMCPLFYSVYGMSQRLRRASGILTIWEIPEMKGMFFTWRCPQHRNKQLYILNRKSQVISPFFSAEIAYKLKPSSRKFSCIKWVSHGDTTSWCNAIFGIMTAEMYLNLRCPCDDWCRWNHVTNHVTVNHIFISVFA